MAAAIINSGRNKIALQQGNSQPLNVVKFVFANVPGVNPSWLIDLEQGLPAAQYITFQKPKTAQGYVANNQVVYSVILTPDEGDFEFNWVGLVDADNVLIAVSYIPLQKKYKTVGLNVGNTLTRNFMLQFNNAAAVTGITVSAQAWQIDFLARLNNSDEMLRANMQTLFGDGAFFGQAFQVTMEDENFFRVKRGLAFVGGYRVEFASDIVYGRPQVSRDIYVDCVLNGSATDSAMDINISMAAPNNPQTHYVDAFNNRHYVVKIANISALSVVTDYRKVHASANSVIDNLISITQSRAPLNNPALTGYATAPTWGRAQNDDSIATAAFAQSLVRGHLVKPTTGGSILISEAEAASPIISVTGALTSNVVVNMPIDVTRIYVFQNLTSGAFSVTVKTVSGTNNVVIPQGKRSLLFCDGINIRVGFTDFESIELGGTPTAPTAAPGNNSKQITNTEHLQAALALLANVARTGSAADLSGILARERLPFSYSTAANANHVAQRDANGHLVVPDVPQNESSAKAVNANFVQTRIASAINALVAAAPGTLDTLHEIATALGNDPNFVTTITNLIGTKAPLLSPALTGSPTAPTQAVGNNSTRIATTAFVVAMLSTLSAVASTGNAADLTGTLARDRLPFSYGWIPQANHVAQRDGNGFLHVPDPPQNESSTKAVSANWVHTKLTNAINALVASAPGTLDTLNEIATALGNDPNFRTTILNLLAEKAPLASPTFTGTPTVPTAPAGTNNNQIASTAYAMAAAAAAAAATMARSPLATLVHVGAVTSYSLNENGFYLVNTNAPSGPNFWGGNAALVFRGAGSSHNSQTVFAASNDMVYITAVISGNVRAYSVNRTTGAETALSINSIHKIG